METTIICRDYLGIYGGYIGIMEKKMETTISGVGLSNCEQTSETYLSWTCRTSALLS